MKISNSIPLCVGMLALSSALAQPAAPSSADNEAATVIYRQQLPSGAIVYSDKAVPGAKVDQTIKVAPPIKGNLWTTEPTGQPPVAAQQARPTPVQHVAALPPTGKKYVPESQRQAAALEVMRAEMLLEDAKKRQAAGSAPLPAELRDHSAGGSPYNQAYVSRQKMLARDVDYATQELRRAQAMRDSLR